MITSSVLFEELKTLVETYREPAEFESSPKRPRWHRVKTGFSPMLPLCRFLLWTLRRCFRKFGFCWC